MIRWDFYNEFILVNIQRLGNEKNSVKFKWFVPIPKDINKLVPGMVGKIDYHEKEFNKSIGFRR